MSGIVKDPVCGINIDKDETLKSFYGQKDYYFCSKSHKTIFEKTRSNYATVQKKSDSSYCS